MMNKERYKKYKDSLNQVIIKELDELKLGNVLAFHIWELISLDRKALIKMSIKSLVKVCFYNLFSIITFNCVGSKILLFNVDRGRNDYNNIYDNTKSTIDQYDEITIKDSLQFSIKNIKSIYLILKYYKRFTSIKNFWDRLYFSVILIKYTGFYNYIKDNVQFTYNLVETFCDAHPYENVIAQYFMKNGSKTVTLQHGQYVYIENSDINSISYENFISDYILSWGEFTNTQFIKAGVDTKRLVIVGNAKYMKSDFKTIQERLSEVDRKVFGVVLEGPSYSFYLDCNVKLINFANLLSVYTGYKYIIKLHPSDDKDKYMKYVDKQCFIEFFQKNKTINEYSQSVDFSLVYISSVYVELNLLLSPVFRYKDKYDFNMGITDKDEFQDIQDLIKKYEVYTNDKVQWLKYMDELSNKYIYKENISLNYKQFFLQNRMDK